jgi:hypothetical protein
MAKARHCVATGTLERVTDLPLVRSSPEFQPCRARLYDISRVMHNHDGDIIKRASLATCYS